MTEGKSTHLERMASPIRPEIKAAEVRRRLREERRKRVHALRDRLLEERGKMSAKEAGMVAGRFSDLLDSLKGEVRRKDLAHRAWPRLSEASAASKLRGYLLPARLKGTKRTERVRRLVRRMRLYVPLTDALAELTNKDEPGYYLPQLVAGTRYEEARALDTKQAQPAEVVATDYMQEQTEHYEPFVELLRRMVERLSEKYGLPRYFRWASRRFSEGTFDPEEGIESAFRGPALALNTAGRISLGPLVDFLQTGGLFMAWDAEQALLPNVALYRAPIGNPLLVQIQFSGKRYSEIATAREAPRPRRDGKIREAKLYRYVEVRLAIAPRDDEGRCQPIFLVYPREALIEFEEIPSLGSFPRNEFGADEWSETLNAALAARYWTCEEYDQAEPDRRVCPSVVLQQEENFYRAVIHDPHSCEDLGRQPSAGNLAGESAKCSLSPRNAFYAVDGASCERFLAKIEWSPYRPIEVFFGADMYLHTSLDGSALAFPWSTVGMALEDSLVGPRPAGPRVSELLEESVRERVEFVEKKIAEERENLSKTYDEALARMFSETQPEENQDDETHD